MPSVGCISVGIPLPLSEILIVPLFVIVTFIVSQYPAIASSIALSITS